MRPISSNSSWGSMTSGTSTIGNLGMLLVHEPNDLPTRFSAITSLQEIASEALITTDTVRAVKALAAGLYSQPSLVRRKCIEALGQSRYHSVVPELRGILRNQNFSENIGDRLRAAKGLGMLRREVIDEVMIDLLSVRYDEDEVAVVRDAAEVAAAKLSLAIRAEEVLSDVRTQPSDLAPAFSLGPEKMPATYFTSILLDSAKPLFERCRAVTSLRNIAERPDSCSPSSCSMSGSMMTYSTLMVIQALTLAFKHYQDVAMPHSTFIRYHIITTLSQINHKMIQTFLLMQLYRTWQDEIVREAAAEGLITFWSKTNVDDDLVNEMQTILVREQNNVVKNCVQFMWENCMETERMRSTVGCTLNEQRPRFSDPVGTASFGDEQ